jgi:hypothetical protein
MLESALFRSLRFLRPQGKSNDEVAERKQIALATQISCQRSLSDDDFLRQVEDRRQEMKVGQPSAAEPQP